MWLRDPEAWDIHKKQKKHRRATGEVAPKKLPGAKEQAKEQAKALLNRVLALCHSVDKKGAERAKRPGQELNALRAPHEKKNI